jgi:hypothetical protein
MTLRNKTKNAVTTVETFTPYQDRDAWFVIRGYVYQVHVTISQWLRLEPDVELHLECGEDSQT